jgi:DNA-binding response OmpR family regulator
MVAADSERSSRSLQHALRSAGYQVTPVKMGPGIMRDLRRRVDKTLRTSPVELLVLDGSERPWVALALVDVVRSVYPSLPIIFVSRLDPEMRAEARRLDVDLIIDAPPDLGELRRAALELAPLVPEPEVVH